MSGELLSRLIAVLMERGVVSGENEEALSGVIATPHGPLLFGASPVLTSEGEGPSRGAMVMARLVDDTLIGEWRELLQGRFVLLDWSAAARELGDGEEDALVAAHELVRKRHGEMTGYGRLLDYAGRPAYLIRAETEQAVYAQGRTTLAVLSALLFIALLLFAALTVGLLERSVLSRLTRLDRAVARIDDRGGDKEVAAIAAADDDEVSRLAGTVDAMVGELARSLHEKEVLLREIHHRVKNNMQVISSLLNMQAAGFDDERTRHALNESRDRVRAMALVHEKLYRTERFARIDFAEYLRSLTAAIAHSAGALAERVRIDYELEPVEVELDAAIHCGLVTNELITNAFEHAFPDGREGTLRIVLCRSDEGRVELTVADDGVGLGDRAEASDSLGLRLVTNLVERQLKGELRIESEGGSVFHIRFDEAAV